MYDLDANPAVNIAGLAACTVVYRLLAYVLLKAKRTHWGDWRREGKICGAGGS